MAHLKVDDLRDEDMQRALVAARSTVARSENRTQHHKDVARKNLLRWLDDAYRGPSAPRDARSERPA